MFDKLFEKIALKVVTKKVEENKKLLEAFVADLKAKAKTRIESAVVSAKKELAELLPEKKAEFEKLFEAQKAELEKLFDAKKDEIKAELIKEIKDSLEKAKAETKGKKK